MMNIIKIKNLLLLFLISLIVVRCTQDFPLNKDLTKQNYNLLNQDSATVSFPSIIKDKTTVMGFIYTHCPDICPITTHNIQLIQQDLEKEGFENINYVLLSFDPERDTPAVLKKYAELRNMNLTNWNLLTGKKSVVSELIKDFEVRAIPTDSSYSDDGELSYSIMHTDRIVLIDKETKLRKYYKGSTINISEIVNDVKDLGE